MGLNESIFFFILNKFFQHEVVNCVPNNRKTMSDKLGIYVVGDQNGIS